MLFKRKRKQAEQDTFTEQEIDELRQFAIRKQHQYASKPFEWTGKVKRTLKKPIYVPDKKGRIKLSSPDLIMYYGEELVNGRIYYIDHKKDAIYNNKLFEITLNGETLAAFVDTGAFTNLLSKPVADRLLSGRKRRTIHTSGWAQVSKKSEMVDEIEFELNGDKYRESFLIDPDVETIFHAEVVLGKPTFEKFLKRTYGVFLKDFFDKGKIAPLRSTLNKEWVESRVMSVSEDLEVIEEAVFHSLLRTCAGYPVFLDNYALYQLFHYYRENDHLPRSLEEFLNQFRLVIFDYDAMLELLEIEPVLVHKLLDISNRLFNCTGLLWREDPEERAELKSSNLGKFQIHGLHIKDRLEDFIPVLFGSTPQHVFRNFSKLVVLTVPHFKNRLNRMELYGYYRENLQAPMGKDIHAFDINSIIYADIVGMVATVETSTSAEPETKKIKSDRYTLRTSSEERERWSEHAFSYGMRNLSQFIRTALNYAILKLEEGTFTEEELHAYLTAHGYLGKPKKITIRMEEYFKEHLFRVAKKYHTNVADLIRFSVHVLIRAFDTRAVEPKDYLLERVEGTVHSSLNDFIYHALKEIIEKIKAEKIDELDIIAFEKKYETQAPAHLLKLDLSKRIIELAQEHYEKYSFQSMSAFIKFAVLKFLEKAALIDEVGEILALNLQVYESITEEEKVDSKESNEIFAIRKGANVITRQFGLLPDMSSKQQGSHGYKGVKIGLLKVRDLENIYIHLMVNALTAGKLKIQDFADSGNIGRKQIYHALHLNSVLSDVFKNVELKERVKRCAAVYPYQAVRNWILKNENLKTILSTIGPLFKADANALLSFFRGKNLSRTHLKTLFNALKKDAFGDSQYLSYFYISNMVRQLRNLFLDTTKLDSLLKIRLSKVKSDSSLHDPFLDTCLGAFTRTKKKKKVPLKPLELPDYFLDRYIGKIKWLTTRAAKRSMSPLSFKKFKKKRDLKLDTVKKSLKTQVSAIRRSKLKALIRQAFLEWVTELETSPTAIRAKHVFKPYFSAIKVDVHHPRYQDYEQYLKEVLKNKVKEHLNTLFLTPKITGLFLREISYLHNNLYSLVTIPKIKKLTLPIIEEAVVRNKKYYDQGIPNLKLDLGLESRKFIPFRINDKKGRIKNLLARGAQFGLPVISYRRRKLILHLPFDVQKKAVSKPSRSLPKKAIEMGVDLGLKDFAVLSVWDKSLKVPKEIARYFLDQKTLMDMKFNARTGKFEQRARFSRSGTDHPSNLKLKLIRLRAEVRNIQRKIHDYENRLAPRGISNPSSKLKYNRLNRILEGLWDRIHHINLELVRLLNHHIIALARHHGVSKIKVENLRWVRPKKRRQAGRFMAFWNVHWFYGHIQEAVALQAKMHGMLFERVNPRNTSKRCSVCGKTDFATRDQKVFKCTNKAGHLHGRDVRLDADLNAARNIALT